MNKVAVRTRSNGGLARLLALILCLAAYPGAWAQVGIGIELPEGSALQISDETVSFDLREERFPPPEFPYYYYPTSSSEPVTLSLFSNVSGGWTIEADFGAGFIGPGGQVIPARQLEYSVNGGPWFEFGPKVALVIGQGTSSSYERHTLELRLQLVGNEAPGVYRGVLNLTLAQF